MQVTTQEAYSAGATAVVKCGLLKQYELATSGAALEDGRKPEHEATILRGLIGISLGSLESKAEHRRREQGQQEQGAPASDAAAPAPTTPASGKGGSHQGPAISSYVEVSGYFNQASRRLMEVGAASFFGDEDVRSAPACRAMSFLPVYQSTNNAMHILQHVLVCTFFTSLQSGVMCQAAQPGVVCNDSLEHRPRGRPIRRLHVERSAVWGMRRLLLGTSHQGCRKPWKAEGSVVHKKQCQAC